MESDNKKEETKDKKGEAIETWESHIKPHGPIRELYPGKLWSVEGTFGKKNDGKRNMVVYKLNSGGLLCHSVVTLNKEGMDQLEALGKPELLIVPNGQHAIDSVVWKIRYPEAIIACPSIMKDILEKKKVGLHFNESTDDLSKYGITSHVVDGMKTSGGFGIGGERCYEVKLSESEHALIFTDYLFNLTNNSGITKLVFGSTFEVPRLIRWSVVTDKVKLKGWLTRMSENSSSTLKVITVAHGDPVIENAAARLKEAALKL